MTNDERLTHSRPTKTEREGMDNLGTLVFKNMPFSLDKRFPSRLLRPPLLSDMPPLPEGDPRKTIANTGG